MKAIANIVKDSFRKIVVAAKKGRQIEMVDPVNVCVVFEKIKNGQAIDLEEKRPLAREIKESGKGEISLIKIRLLSCPCCSPNYFLDTRVELRRVVDEEHIVGEVWGVKEGKEVLVITMTPIGDIKGGD